MINQHTETVVEKLEEILSVFSEIQGENRDKILQTLKSQNLTKEDLDIISGRKDGLEKFEIHLNDYSRWKESNWQDFFKNQTWIFGYGLDYRFLQILQREAHLSGTDLDGRNSVTGDFLAGCNNFTVLIELKRPDTPLFKQTQNRADSWKLSSELVDAVSQILSQKANWIIEGEGENFNDAGELISQKTYDPKAILIIGNTRQFDGNAREIKIKMKTFELFRRNLRNIEIITFDELLERARFIVEHKSELFSDS